MEMKIENIIASKDLGAELDIEKLKDNISSAEYNPKKFPGLIVKIKFPKSTVLIFRSGKVVSTGCRSFEDAEKTIDMVVKEIKKVYPDVNSSEMKIHNIVTSFQIKGTIRLDDLVPLLEVDGLVDYNPEKFPGVIFKDTKKGVGALIFDNGKVIITGGRNMEDTEEMANIILEVLENGGVVEE